MDQTDEQVRLVADDGTLLEHDVYKVDLSDDELRDLYVKLVVVRRIDTEGTNLQRQGQLGIWAPCLGQEAAQVGSAIALRPEDFIFPSYREQGVAYVRAVDIVKVLELYRGASLSGWDPHEKNFALYSILIGTQPVHAGAARGRLRHRRQVGRRGAVHGRLLRRRRHQRGRHQRGLQLRRRELRSGGVLLPEQPVGHLGAPLQADGGADLAALLRLRLPRRAGGRQRRAGGAGGDQG